MKKLITHSEKLQLLGLLSLGVSHYKIVRQAEDEMCKILNIDGNYADVLSDSLYEEDLDIDKALLNMGIEVEDE